MSKIAIVGIGCAFPGVKNKEEFWDALVENRELTETISVKDDQEFMDHAEGGYEINTDYLKCGLSPDYDFDLSGLKVPSEQLKSRDVLFQRTIAITKQALGDASLLSDSSKLSRTGMIMGNLGSITESTRSLFSDIYKDIYSTKTAQLLGLSNLLEPSLSLSPEETMTDSGPVSLSAKAFGLGGPCYSIDNACASSIYVLKLASYYLLSGQVDCMIAGGVSEVCGFSAASLFSTLDVLPPNCDSKPFDRTTKGLMLATGGGAFVLKRYEDAVKAKDNIHAVIEGVGLSNDGGGKYILAPSVGGQVRAFEKAYEGLDKNVDYIECHATGTNVGDIIELDSVANFFKNEAAKPLIGALKPNMGHILTASGMSAMIKVIMGMKHDMIPATINVENPIESSDGSYNKERMVLSNTTWPKNAADKRAGVSAFGFGGSNSHVVLREHSDEYFASLQAAKSLEVNQEISIVGMGIKVGEVKNLNDFSDLIANGQNKFTRPTKNKWMGFERQESFMEKYGITASSSTGSYIFDLDVDFLKFNVSPNSHTRAIFKEFVLMSAADEAIKDAGLVKGRDKRVAVVIGIEADGSSHRAQYQPDAIKDVIRKVENAGISLDATQKKHLSRIMRDSINFRRSRICSRLTFLFVTEQNFLGLGI